MEARSWAIPCVPEDTVSVSMETHRGGKGQGWARAGYGVWVVGSCWVAVMIAACGIYGSQGRSWEGVRTGSLQALVCEVKIYP